MVQQHIRATHISLKRSKHTVRLGPNEVVVVDSDSHVAPHLEVRLTTILIQTSEIPSPDQDETGETERGIGVNRIGPSPGDHDEEG